MYRAPAPVPCTEIVYASRQVQTDRIAGGVAIVLVGLALLFGMMGTRRLACTRSACVVDTSYIVWTSRRTFPLGDIVGLELRTRHGQKGDSIDVELVARSERVRLDRMNVGTAAAAAATRDRAAFEDFYLGKGASFEATFGNDGETRMFLLFVLALVFGAGLSLVWGELRQLRTLRIVVDHGRRIVRLGGKEIAFADIAEVRVQIAHELARERLKKDMNGRRLVVVRRDGASFPVQRHFDHGGGHEAARDRLVAALGERLSA